MFTTKSSFSTLIWSLWSTSSIIGPEIEAAVIPKTCTNHARMLEKQISKILKKVTLQNNTLFIMRLRYNYASRAKNIFLRDFLEILKEMFQNSAKF